MNKSLQYELWQECNSLCDFCYLGTHNRNMPDDLKIKVLQDTLQKLQNINSDYDTIAFIGGEFFQGQLKHPEVRDLFFKLMKRVQYLIAQRTFQSFWLTATLTIGNQEDLYKTLDIFKDFKWDKTKSEGFWLCTSYDTIGRFHKKEMEDNWKYHMKNIKNLYNIKFNTTIIITADLINKFLANEFSFTEFQKEYDTTIFFKQPAEGSFENMKNRQEAKEAMQKLVPNFFPERTMFIKFLKKLVNENPELYDKMFNVKYRADTLFRNFDIF